MTSAAKQGQRPPVTETPAARGEKRAQDVEKQPREIGGPAGPEPTRFGDWERAGRCVDF